MTPTPYRYTFDEAVAAEVRAEIARDPKMSITSLAEKLGVRRATLSSRVNGHTPFRASELQAIADALGITVSELATRAEKAIATKRHNSDEVA